MVVCPYCGKENFQPDAVYCQYCGSSLSQARPAAAAPVSAPAAPATSTWGGSSSSSTTQSEEYERALAGVERWTRIVLLLSVIAVVLVFL